MLLFRPLLALSRLGCALAVAVSTSAGAVPLFDQSTPGQYTFTVPSSGTYRIDALGASGGASLSGATGGLGAHLAGDFLLSAGDVLRILVGGAGPSKGGGGGGSFVLLHASPTSALLVAGGGGGSGASGNGAEMNGRDASLTTAGTAGGFASGPILPAGAGGTAGSGGGGTGDASDGGAGGGGLLSAGGNATFGLSTGGRAAINGGAGGGHTAGAGAVGGFGGGGGSLSGGGGGGGYSGGGGGGIGANYGGGGGGGSFNASITNATAVLASAAGNGRVFIDLLVSNPSVPEPATAALVALALGTMAWRRRAARATAALPAAAAH